MSNGRGSSFSEILEKLKASAGDSAESHFGAESSERMENQLTELRRAAQQGVFRAANYVAEPAPGSNIRGIWISAGITNRSGYAHVAIADALLIRRLGVQSYFIPHRAQAIDWDLIPQDRKELIEEYQKGVVGIGDTLICEWPPHEAVRMLDVTDRTVMRTTCETSTVSKVAVEMCNLPDVTAIWFCSEFARQAFVRSGVNEDKSKTILPPVIRANGGKLWNVSVRDDSSLEKRIDRDHPFCFGSMGTLQERKGFHNLIRAYYSSFSAEDPVRLVIRTSPFGQFRNIDEVKRELERITSSLKQEIGKTSYPKITAKIGTELTDDEMIAWLGSIDCYVNASFGEGTGIPLLYARASGVPVITTLFGGIPETLGGEFEKCPPMYKDADGREYDDFIPHFDQKIPVEMIRTNSIFEPGLKWGGYDVSDFAKAMQRQASTGRRRNLRGAEDTQNKFDARRLEIDFESALGQITDLTRLRLQG